VKIVLTVACCGWQSALDEKLAAIEQNKVDLIALVKQTSAKLKFTLNGSVARDLDYLSTKLQTSQERLASLNAATDEALHVLSGATSDCPEINVCQFSLLWHCPTEGGHQAMLRFLPLSIRPSVPYLLTHKQCLPVRVMITVEH